MLCAHAHKLKLMMETAGAENRRGLCWRSARFELLAPTLNRPPNINLRFIGHGKEGEYI